MAGLRRSHQPHYGDRTCLIGRISFDNGCTMGLTTSAETDLVDEVAQHLEKLFRRLRSSGTGPERLLRQAMAELDDLYPLRARPGKESTHAKDYQSQNRVFGSLAGFSSPRGVTLQDHGTAEGLFAELVTDNYFSTLGLTPARGRFSLRTRTPLPARTRSPF